MPRLAELAPDVAVPPPLRDLRGWCLQRLVMTAGLVLLAAGLLALAVDRTAQGQRLVRTGERLQGTVTELLAHGSGRGRDVEVLVRLPDGTVHDLRHRGALPRVGEVLDLVRDRDRPADLWTLAEARTAAQDGATTVPAAAALLVAAVALAVDGARWPRRLARRMATGDVEVVPVRVLQVAVNPRSNYDWRRAWRVTASRTPGYGTALLVDRGAAGTDALRRLAGTPARVVRTRPAGGRSSGALLVADGPGRPRSWWLLGSAHLAHSRLPLDASPFRRSHERGDQSSAYQAKP